MCGFLVFYQSLDLKLLMKLFNFFTLNGLVSGFNTSRQKGELPEDKEIQTISSPTVVEVPIETKRNR